MPDDSASTNHSSSSADLGLLQRLGVKVRLAVRDLKAAQARVAELEAYKTSADAELVKYRTERDPSAVAERADRLAHELRDLKHKAVFDRVATELGARPGAAVDDLYKLSGYKAESEEIDEAAVRSAVESQKSIRAYLFADAAESTDRPTPPTSPAAANLAAGPGSNRGGSASRPPQKYTEAQLSDPAFVIRNYSAVAAAAKDALSRTA